MKRIGAILFGIFACFPVSPAFVGIPILQDAEKDSTKLTNLNQTMASFCESFGFTLNPKDNDCTPQTTAVSATPPAAMTEKKPVLSNPVVFTAGGKTYYVNDLAKLVSAKDICINNVVDGDVNTLYTTLRRACQQGIAESDEKIKAGGGKSPVPIRGVVRVINDFLLPIDSRASPRDALADCLLLKEMWLKALKDTEKNAHNYTVLADIDACINSIGEHWDDGNSCPINPSVRDKKLIANITNVMSDKYQGKTFHFNLRKGERLNTPFYYGVFNGDIFVICDTNKVAEIVYPVYSGMLQCQDSLFQSIPGFGSTPNGVYVARHEDIESIDDALISWGDYRIPLIPANETQTYGRTNMYLHGTSVPSKEQSGGCLSLGRRIADFVTIWDDKLAQVDLVIFVQIDQVQSVRGNRSLHDIADECKMHFKKVKIGSTEVICEGQCEKDVEGCNRNVLVNDNSACNDLCLSISISNKYLYQFDNDKCTCFFSEAYKFESNIDRNLY